MNRITSSMFLLLLLAIFMGVESLNSKEEQKMKEKLLKLKGILYNVIKFNKVTNKLKKVLKKIHITVSGNQTDKANTSFESTNPMNYTTTKMDSQPTEITQDKFFSKCCALGFRPAEIENKADIDCFKTGFDKLPANIRGNGTDDSYWVTGFDLNLNRTFTICSDYRVIPDNLWVVGEPDNARGVESCVRLDLRDKVGLADGFCMYPLRYICEITYEK
ncbi:hypothetical protein B566_EDAN009807 [Ephemera danica]|nr:hypothetical protein B566_EDAN009807 [Ephemera danica]